MNGCCRHLAAWALAGLPLLAGATGPTGVAGRPTAQLQCQASGMGPRLDCTVRLTTGGQPLEKARVSLGAFMPSMPMAHSVKPIAAAATGQPGEYRGVLELEMNGIWALQIDIAGPPRERIVRNLRIEDCDGHRPCPVAPVQATQRKP